jgi:pre-mRNA-splicing factor ATP-dependent RNA helicase DHX15/PRP43
MWADFWFFRLLEYATTYFDLSSFPDGETKRALMRVANKKAGKANRVDGTADTRETKKRKKNKS